MISLNSTIFSCRYDEMVYLEGQTKRSFAVLIGVIVLREKGEVNIHD